MNIPPNGLATERPHGPPNGPPNGIPQPTSTGLPNRPPNGPPQGHLPRAPNPNPNGQPPHGKAPNGVPPNGNTPNGRPLVKPDIVLGKYCKEAIHDLEKILSQKHEPSEAELGRLARTWWKKFVHGDDPQMTSAAKRMEGVYLALTRHMATRRDPTTRDQNEDAQDRLRFRDVCVAFVTDLLHDWHPWATRMVKEQVKQEIAAGKRVGQSWDNVEGSLYRLEATMLLEGDDRLSFDHAKVFGAKKQTPQGMPDLARKLTRSGFVQQNPNAAAPPPCPTPPPAVPGHTGPPRMRPTGRTGATSPLPDETSPPVRKNKRPPRQRPAEQNGAPPPAPPSSPVQGDAALAGADAFVQAAEKKEQSKKARRPREQNGAASSQSMALVEFQHKEKVKRISKQPTGYNSAPPPRPANTGQVPLPLIREEDGH